MRSIIRLLIVPFAVLGCSSAPTDPNVDPGTVSVANIRWHLEIGDTDRFVTSIPGQTVRWESSNQAALTIDRFGLARARAVGTARVSVFTSSGASAGWDLEVINPVASLRVRPDSVDMVAGDAASLSVVGLDASGVPVSINLPNTQQEIDDSTTWSVDDTTIGWIPAGAPSASTLRALHAGRTSVRASLAGHTGTMPLNVREVRFVDVAAGGSSSCGVTTDSLVYCWGAINSYMFPGDDAAGGRFFIPHRVGPPGLSLVSVTLGTTHACGLTATGVAFCWGTNDFGQLGIGSANQPFGPVAVAGNHRFSSLSGGDGRTCGIATDGATFCWGTLDGLPFDSGPEVCGDVGKFDTRTACARAPLVVGSGSPRLSAIAVGTSHTCGIDGAGTAYCWGSMAGPTPVVVAIGTPLVAIASGAYFSCGLDAEHHAYCWGANNFGSLGDGTTIGRDVPAPVAGGLAFTSLRGGNVERYGGVGGLGCGISVDATLYCWGQLSSAAASPQLTPAPLLTPTQFGSGFMSAAIGVAHLCGVSVSGLLYCWGNNGSGQLGVLPGPPMNSPVLVSGQRPAILW